MCFEGKFLKKLCNIENSAKKFEMCSLERSDTTAEGEEDASPDS